MHIREAYGQDIGKLSTLWVDLVSHHRQLDPALPAVAAHGPEKYAYLLHHFLTREDGVIFVAVAEKGDIVGYAFGLENDLTPDYFMASRGGVMSDVYVLPEWRRRGIGRALVARMLTWFKARGLTRVEWDVVAKNEVALAFWQSVGGQPLTTRMQLTLQDDEET